MRWRLRSPVPTRIADCRLGARVSNGAWKAAHHFGPLSAKLSPAGLHVIALIVAESFIVCMSTCPVLRRWCRRPRAPSLLSKSPTCSQAKESSVHRIALQMVHFCKMLARQPTTSSKYFCHIQGMIRQTCSRVARVVPPVPLQHPHAASRTVPSAKRAGWPPVPRTHTRGANCALSMSESKMHLGNS